MQRAIVWIVIALGCGEEPREPAPRGEPAPSETVIDEDAPVTAQTLFAFVPERLGGYEAVMRQVSNPLAIGAYRAPSGLINLNLGITQSVVFDRAQVRSADSDAIERSEAAGVETQGVAVGRFRGLRVTMSQQTELRLFLEERIHVRVSMEGQHTNEELVALARELDLEGLARLAPRIPAPIEPH
jgi:hypothetical protein